MRITTFAGGMLGMAASVRVEKSEEPSWHALMVYDDSSGLFYDIVDDYNDCLDIIVNDTWYYESCSQAHSYADKCSALVRDYMGEYKSYFAPIYKMAESMCDEAQTITDAYCNDDIPFEDYRRETAYFSDEEEFAQHCFESLLSDVDLAFEDLRVCNTAEAESHLDDISGAKYYLDALELVCEHYEGDYGSEISSSCFHARRIYDEAKEVAANVRNTNLCWEGEKPLSYLPNPGEWVDSADWIGKYHGNGSEDFVSVIATLDMVYGDADGLTTWGEMNDYMLAAGHDVEADLGVDYEDDHPWTEDAQLMSYTMTNLYADEGGATDEATALQLLTLFGLTDQEAKDYFDQQSVLPLAAIEAIAAEMISGSTDQFDGVGSYVAQILQSLDDNADKITTLSELISGINKERAAHGHHLIGAAHGGTDYIGIYGAHYDWTHDYALVATLIADGYWIDSYSGAYEMAHGLGFPQIVDTFFGNQTDMGRHGISLSDLEGFIQHIYHDHSGDWLDIPDDWMPLNDRNQTYWTTQVFTEWFNMIKPLADTNQDGHITFRELLNYWQHPDTDQLINEYGENVEWWNKHHREFGMIYTSLFQTNALYTHGIEDLTYKQTYNMAATMSDPRRPWVIDLIDYGAFAGRGMSPSEDGTSFFYNWMFVEDDIWFSEKPDDWVFYEGRIIPTEPFVTSEKQDREQFQQQTKTMILYLEQLLESSYYDLEDLTWYTKLDPKYEELKDIYHLISLKY